MAFHSECLKIDGNMKDRINPRDIDDFFNELHPFQKMKDFRRKEDFEKKDFPNNNRGKNKKK
jgi:hypothetical protein